MQNGTATLEDSLEVSYKTKHTLTIQSRLCGQFFVHTKTCTWMFKAALFIIAKTWKQPGHPPVGRWINKLWYIQTMKYYLVVKRNELSDHERTRRNLKCMLLSEKVQSEKAAYWVIPTSQCSGKGK